MSTPTEISSRARQPPVTFAHAFSARVRTSPEAVFVCDPQGKVLTYREAEDRASAIGIRLQDRGIGPGGRVGLYLPNTPVWPVASLGTWGLGASVTACGILLAAGEAERAFCLTGVDAVITTEPGPVAGGDRPVLTVDEFGRLPGDASTVSSSVEEPRVPRAEDEAVVFFTSGTTGAPKGIPHRHADLMQWAEQVASAYAKISHFRDTTAPESAAPGVIFTPFGHIGGYLSLVFRVWIGRAVVLVPKFSTEVVEQLLARYEFQALQLTPTTVHMLAHTEHDLPLGRLRYVTSSTAPMTTATCDAFESRYGIPVIQAYGMTEVGTISQERYEDVRAGRRPRNSVGRAATGVDVRILGEDGSEAPLQEPGEILVRTASAAPDYVGEERPQVTDGWFHTGDIGRLDEDGFLYITGRSNDKIIVGGFNVYPAEVEDVLRRSDAVIDADVVGMPDDRLGERPVAIVVWRSAAEIEALREEARAVLAHYKVPRAWIAVPAVPHTARGKVDRLRVRELIAEAML